MVTICFLKMHDLLLLEDLNKLKASKSDIEVSHFCMEQTLGTNSYKQIALLCTVIASNERKIWYIRINV